MRILSLIFCLLYFSYLHAADTLSYSVKNINDWVYYGEEKPKLEISARNNNSSSVLFDIECNVKDFKGNQVYSLGQKGKVALRDSALLLFVFQAINPGFYEVDFVDKEGEKKQVNIAYNPEKIVEESVGKEDFKKFLWLLQIDNSRVSVVADSKENNRLSGRERTVYDVKINTIDGGSVSGYLAVPDDGKKEGTIITFICVDEKKSNPLANFTKGVGMSELVIFVKKEWKELYINEVVVSTMKCVDYIRTLKNVNSDKIFVQGKGTAGAYAFVACAASEKVKGGIIENPIFDNFINKFSYNSFGEMVNAPILMGFGLQNNVENLQKIFSVFNNVKSKKEYFGFPTAKNILPDEWRIIKRNFLDKF